jgi:DNA-binding response OmpR family regulator
MRKHRLLIIEDDSNIADLVSRVALDAGYDVKAACTLKGITELYESFQPHLILLDIVMPDMDGFEVLNYLHSKHSKSRVVIMSGQVDYGPMASRMGDALALQVETTLTKPFRVAELRNSLKKLTAALPQLEADSHEAA